MTVKTIAIGLLSAAEAEWLVPRACDLARGFGAHLIGVHPSEPMIPYTGGEAAFAPVVTPMFLDWQIEEAAAIRETFARATRVEDFSTDFRGQEVGGLGAEDFLLDSLRGADLVLLGGGDRRGWAQDRSRLQDAVIRNSGRPVLMLPARRGLAGPVDRLLVGWSPTREATRAVHDALALARPGAAIDLLSVRRRGADPVIDSRPDLAAALDRHGFKVTLVEREAPESQVAEILLQVAAETGPGLIVTGAFGHSRAYDFVVGAVTRSLLEMADRPVLLAK
jgi:nucleotide-binding universal stress UspA family protein